MLILEEMKCIKIWKFYYTIKDNIVNHCENIFPKVKKVKGRWKLKKAKAKIHKLVSWTRLNWMEDGSQCSREYESKFFC
jgi:hypothetical protein